MATRKESSTYDLSRWLRSEPDQCQTKGQNQIDAENTDSFLLEHIGRIEHIDVQQDVTGKAPGLRLKAESLQRVRLPRDPERG
jgi:hypothetical protein